jgi:uncharacterized protein YbjT (DUF2867 family)
MQKTAIVIGATGLIGNHLTRLLLDDDRYKRVKVFARRSTEIDHPRLEEHLVDFDDLNAWKDRIIGHELYSALGTTARQAKSKDAQYKVDVTYQFDVARDAAANAVQTYMLVSSAGADPRSNLFYPRIKGELEERVKALPFQRIAIFRPSVLVGDRPEKRSGERIGVLLARPLAWWRPPRRKYRPIKGRTVAQAMIQCANSPEAPRLAEVTLDQIQPLATPDR